MNRLLMIGLVVLLACSVHAGGNPDVRMYIDFDPPNYIHEITPELYTQFTAYVCVDQLAAGMTAIAFRLSDLEAEYPFVTAPPSFQVSLPWPFPITCIPWWPPGVTLTGDCTGGGGEPVVIGEVLMFYLGGAGCLRVLYHDDYPGWVVDCSDSSEIDHHCVLAHASIGGAQCPDGDCGETPVEPRTWGSVKALYR